MVYQCHMFLEFTPFVDPKSTGKKQRFSKLSVLQVRAKEALGNSWEADSSCCKASQMFQDTAGRTVPALPWHGGGEIKLRSRCLGTHLSGTQISHCIPRFGGKRLF